LLVAGGATVPGQSLGSPVFFCLRGNGFCELGSWSLLTRVHQHQLKVRDGPLRPQKTNGGILGSFARKNMSTALPFCPPLSLADSIQSPKKPLHLSLRWKKKMGKNARRPGRSRQGAHFSLVLLPLFN
jgi:hypothetical protein